MMHTMLHLLFKLFVSFCLRMFKVRDTLWWITHTKQLAQFQMTTRKFTMFTLILFKWKISLHIQGLFWSITKKMLTYCGFKAILKISGLLILVYATHPWEGWQTRLHDNVHYNIAKYRARTSKLNQLKESHAN